MGEDLKLPRLAALGPQFGGGAKAAGESNFVLQCWLISHHHAPASSHDSWVQPQQVQYGGDPSFVQLRSNIVVGSPRFPGKFMLLT